MKVILVDSWRDKAEKTVELKDALLICATESYGESSGQIEDLRDKVDKTVEILSKLIEVLVETKTLSLSQALVIVGMGTWSRHQIKEIL